MTWGNGIYGGNSASVAGLLDGTIKVNQIVSSMYAFAAIKEDGSVVTWGSSLSVGDSSKVVHSISGTIDVTQVFSSDYSFAALREDGSLVVWGSTTYLSPLISPP